MKNKKTNLHGTIVLAFGIAWLICGGADLAAVENGSAVLTKLALDPVSAKESILDSLTSGSVYNYKTMEAFKALPASARAAIVSAGLGWIKAYVETAEFQTAYGEYRAKEKPETPAVRPAQDEQIKKQKAEFEKQVVEMRKSMAGLDAATKESMDNSIKEMRAQMEAMEKDPQQKELMRQMTEMARSEDKKKYEEQLADWDSKFPADPRLLIKKRINAFLAASAGVDFAAKLAVLGDKMVFVNGDYEQKPPEWKVCFRAGKEATDAARAFAKTWLTELEKK
jgi:hypothetical protein